MDYRGHGGACCGIAHLFSFDHGTVAEFDRLLRGHFTEGNGNRLLEVVLSQRQVDGDRQADCVRRRGGWPQILAENGFRLVTGFNNSNSNRNCYVFHKIPNTIALPVRWWNGSYATYTEGAVPLQGPAQAPGEGIPAQAPVAPWDGTNRRALAVGDTVVYDDRGRGGGNYRAGQTGVVTIVDTTGLGNLSTVMWDHLGHAQTAATNRLRLIEDWPLIPNGEYEFTDGTPAVVEGRRERRVRVRSEIPVVNGAGIITTEEFDYCPVDGVWVGGDVQWYPRIRNRRPVYPDIQAAPVQEAPQGPVVQENQPRRQHHVYRAGDRVTYMNLSGNGRREWVGRTGTVTRDNIPNEVSVTIRWDGGVGTSVVAIGNIALIEAGRDAGNRQRDALVEMTRLGEEFEAAPIAPPVAPVEDARVLRVRYHNVYAIAGRTENGFPRFDEARAAGQRARYAPRQIDRHEILSDGTDRWIENVTE